VADVLWSRCGGEDCLRVAGVPRGADVRVRAGTVTVAGEFPPMAGRIVHDDGDTCFVPRFAFVEGSTYTVVVEGAAAGVLVRPRPHRAATTEVLDIWPAAGQVPRNLLRIYVQFSSRMSEGYGAGHVRLVDAANETMTGVFLPTEHELWDADRRRLTVLLDPARIKRGLVSNVQTGYPLIVGASVRVVVDEGFCDASGAPLQAPAERRYEVQGDERRRIDPGKWVLAVPLQHTNEGLDVAFDRPLDHGLLARCLHVLGPDNQRVDGTSAIGPNDRSWRLSPRAPWVSGPYQLIVDPVLEDLAGNSVSRVFDRDLSRVEDRSPEAPPASLTFYPTAGRGHQ